MFNRIIILILLSCKFILSAQNSDFKSNMQVYYNLKFKSDSTSSVISYGNVDLYIGDKGSIYQVKGKRELDSIIVNNHISKFPVKPIYKINNVIKKDYQAKNITYTEMIEGVNYGYIENLAELNKWILLPETKKIADYICHKAQMRFRGRNYIAWYTKEIPISDGPYKFAGLPGLVLELYDDKENFVFTLSGITKYNLNVLYNNNFKSLDRNKLFETKISNILKSERRFIKFNPIEL